MREIFEEGREASVRRIVLLLLAALVAGCGLGTLLGTGRVTVDLGAGPAVAAGTVARYDASMYGFSRGQSDTRKLYSPG